MKVGILTIYGGVGNYGNMLQNYALQQFLASHQIDSETIRYDVIINDTKVNGKKFVKVWNKLFADGLIEGVWRGKRYWNQIINKKKIQQLSANRQNLFDIFESTYIKTSKKKYYDVQDLDELNQEYDMFVVGSDQVWNPYGHGSHKEFFLTFTERKKRIAYAPSVGVNNVPSNHISSFKHLLNGFDALSCREKTGAELIEQISGRNCEHVMDPVMLAGRGCWVPFIKFNNNGKYLLTYFLGEPLYADRRKIDEIARRKGLSIINIYDRKSIDSAFVGVEDFISLIANANLFVTDSFHGCVFSIMLETDFLICDRKFANKNERMNSRVDDLLFKLQIGDHNIRNEKNIEPIDYARIDAIMDEWRTKSETFLMGQLKDVNVN